MVILLLSIYIKDPYFTILKNYLNEIFYENTEEIRSVIRRITIGVGFLTSLF